MIKTDIQDFKNWHNWHKNTGLSHKTGVTNM